MTSFSPFAKLGCSLLLFTDLRNFFWSFYFQGLTHIYIILHDSQLAFFEKTLFFLMLHQVTYFGYVGL